MLSSISQGHSEVRMNLLMRSKSTGSSAWEEAIRHMSSVEGKYLYFLNWTKVIFFQGVSETNIQDEVQELKMDRNLVLNFQGCMKYFLKKEINF